MHRRDGAGIDGAGIDGAGIDGSGLLSGLGSAPDLGRLATAAGHPGRRVGAGIFRFCVDPPPLAEVGTWLAADHPAVPAWLHPFGGEVLVVLDDTGSYLAGVGIKRHHETGSEIAVGTEPAARGRGLARRLVAQAARRIVAGGAVATYLHAPDNVASAHVADASGFPDRGWRFVSLF
jgi:GNAT superfamily N-acetyltransferase